MFYPGYNPATDDLYTYSGEGFPTGWNSGHALYSYRSQLTWIGVASRSLSLAGSGGDTTFCYDGVGGVPPVDPSQYPNYFNPRLPTLSFVDDRLAIGAMHFWYNGDTTRARPVALDLWALPQIKTLDADGTLRTFTNANFRGPWNEDPLHTRRAQTDCGLCEYETGTPHPGPFPPLFRVDTYPNVAVPGWMIERNGRAIPVTYSSPAEFPGAPGYWMDPSKDGTALGVDFPDLVGIALYNGDSGNVLITIIDGTVMLVGHVYSASEIQPAYATGIRPDVPHLASYGHSVSLYDKPMDYAPASEAAALQANQDILDMIASL